jgi:hypothetical protein
MNLNPSKFIAHTCRFILGPLIEGSWNIPLAKANNVIKPRGYVVCYRQEVFQRYF